MHFKMLGKIWRLEWVRRFKDREQHGECDHPEKINKAIRVREGMSELDTLDTLIHECMHCGFWQIDEEFVSQFSTDLARLLVRLGYRRQ